MNDLLQPVLNKYPKVISEKQMSPTYVTVYTKNKSEIFLVCAKNDQKSIAKTFSNGGQTLEDDLDLTGSPLKVDLSLHLDDTLIFDAPKMWTRDEEVHGPIDIEKAREISNTYIIIQSKLPKEDTTPLWALITPSSPGKPLLLTVHSDLEQLTRGLVTYEGTMTLDEVNVDKLVQRFAKTEGIGEDMIQTVTESKHVLSGVPTSHLNPDDLLNAPINGLTELSCEWNVRTLTMPDMGCKAHLSQEAIIGHVSSPCNSIWKSVCALNNINQLLVDINAAGQGAVQLEEAYIRNPNQEPINNSKRLKELFNQTESYSYSSESVPGGCLCVTDDTTSLKQAMSAHCRGGSSNDFTYRLFDILRDSNSAEELIKLFIQALKFVSTGQIRPFIDSNNKTYLSKLVLKLSRGHSQAPKLIKNLQSSPVQALSLVAQVGFEKTMWEYTRIMSLLDHSYQIANIWNVDAKNHESIEQINQTIQDLSISGVSDFTLNPFENVSSSDYSIRVDCGPNDDEIDNLTVDDFASLKKHGLVEQKDVNEVPLIADDIDTGPWKHQLKRFAQVHACLEHLCRAELSLMLDLSHLKPISARLIEHFISEKSPVKTVGQLTTNPTTSVLLTVAAGDVKYHLEKPAYWYRVEMSRKDKAKYTMGVRRDSRLVYVFSQQHVFPTSVTQVLGLYQNGFETNTIWNKKRRKALACARELKSQNNVCFFAVCTGEEFPL